ncbi:MAG: UDP-N-acetylmuramoyl-tripeptide--D-alanyl-D-alanine ligase [Elusimicrobiota bacterium]
MKKIKLGKIAAWTEGELNRADHLKVNGAVIDSRQAFEGSLFFCLKGENNDGHDYVEEVREKGGYTIGEQQKCDIVVSSTLKALWEAARNYRKILKLSAVGITGSSGKTTTVGLTEKLLSTEVNVAATPKSFNNNIGIPLTLLNIEPEKEIGVFEMGANNRGEIAKLSDLIHLDVGVITNVNDAHIGYFGSYKNILKTKFELVDNISESGYLVYNYDQKNVREKAENYGINKLGFGFKNGADIKADLISCNMEGSRFKINGENYSIKIPGKFNVYNALAAIAMAKIFNIKKENIKTAIKKFDTRAHRMKKVNLAGIKFIDDSYNANPTAVKELFREIASMYPDKNIVAVVGEMHELGEYAPKLHREVGEFIGKIPNVKYILSSGRNGKELRQGAQDGGMKDGGIYLFKTKKEAADIIRKVSDENSVIVLKASRREKFDEILREFK